MNTSKTRIAAVVALIATAAVVSSAAVAQTFPDKPVRLVLPFPVGGGADIVSRVVAEKLSTWWGQSVIVDNKPGASGFIAADAVKRAPADGYTLLVADAAIMALSPHLYKRLPYDPLKDFDAIAPMYSTHFFVTVPVNSPLKNVGELIAAAKAKKGSTTYASSGVGSHMHLGGAMLETMTNTPMTHVPYKELSLAFQDVSRGDVDWAFGSGATTAPMYQSKKIKYLAIAAPERHPSYPEIPTVSEAGGPSNFELRVWVGLFAPHGTPPAVVEKIHADIAKALRESDVRLRLQSLGIQLWPGTTDELKKAIADDSRTFKAVVDRVKIALD